MAVGGLQEHSAAIVKLVASVYQVHVGIYVDTPYVTLDRYATWVLRGTLGIHIRA